METALLFKQIDSLPKSVQQQLADYIAFLVEKYGGKEDSDGPSEAEWAIIDAEVEAFERDPSSAVPAEVVFEQLRNRHGNV